VKWINSLEPDIIGLQELVGWNEERLQQAALQWNHPHVVTLKRGGYNIGLTSRDPIEVIDRHTQGFWHGYLHCRTNSIDVIVTHLWPGTRPQQVREATILRDLVVSLVKGGRQVILMGDFNAHSAADKSMLDKQAPLLARRGPGDIKKKPEQRFIRDGKFTFDVMNTILEAPLHDVVRESFDAAHHRPDYDDQLNLGSFPTRVLGHTNTVDTQKGFLERIDFILTTQSLARSCTSATVCRTAKELESISDHYPLFAEFSPNKDRGTTRKKQKND